ncbi:hypothetical protein B0H11DRAFT_1902489 [Mycena galericulata]|nr:hypothetical protein B0H11DRAFT_1902489 [Mycena galericulata]
MDDTDSQAECDCAKRQDSSSEDEPDPPKNVLDIVLGAIPDASKAAAGKRRGGKIISTLFGQANQEANKGMRPPKSSDAGSSKKEKGKSKAEAPRPTTIYRPEGNPDAAGDAQASLL